jgi:hypothetical protein
MSLPPSLPTPILETVLTRLAALFLAGAGGDTTAARHAASQMLAAYHPRTPDELRVAANIVIFSFQALEALAQACTPDISITRILRLRGGAVSLSREAAKAERHLGQLQKAPQQPIQAQQPEIQPAPAQPEPAQQPPPGIEQTAAPIHATAAIPVAPKTRDLTWTQAYEQRDRDTRIAASLQRAQARIAGQPSPATPHAVPDRRLEHDRAGRNVQSA